MDPAKIVAEIGCNHMGQINIARKMIEVAALSGANYAKFQKRNPRELLLPEEYDAPHPVSYFSYGKTYGEHREALEFSIEQHDKLAMHCKNIGIGYACSVWDITSAKEICSLRPDYVKIPSAMNSFFELYETIFSYGFDGQIHISLGMTTKEEEDRIFKFFKERQKLDKLVFYHCTSAYPAPFESLKLETITSFKNRYPVTIGYSGHNYGIAADVAAFILGAEWIERHFTLDRTLRGTDHAASLEPGGLSRLCRDIRNVSKAMGVKSEKIEEYEEEQRKKLKKTKLEVVHQ